MTSPSYFLVSVSTHENLELCAKHALAGFPSGESGAWTFCEIEEGDFVSFLYGARAVADMNAMLQQIPLLKACSPQVDAHAQVVYENQNWNTTYRGVSPEYQTIRRWAVAEGGMFTQDDVDGSASVALIGQTVKGYLFPNIDPLGRTIRVGASLRVTLALSEARKRSSRP